MSSVSSNWGFVNPPDMGSWGDFSENSVYVEGSIFNLVWDAPRGVALSLRLYQANLTTGEVLGDSEYILQSVINRTDYTWRVALNGNEDLKTSNVFMLALYQETHTDVMGTSHYFNITAKSTTDSGTTTSSSTISSTSSISTTSRTSSSITGASETVSSSPTATPSPSSEGLSQAAKIAIGVSIPLAVILGVLAGWLFFKFCFGRRREHSNSPQASNAEIINDYTAIGQLKPELGGDQRYEMTGDGSHMYYTGHTDPGLQGQQIYDRHGGNTTNHYELYAPMEERRH